jgi:hypothetical protein
MAGDDRLDGFGDCLIDMGLRFYGPPGPLANKIARTIWALLVRGRHLSSAGRNAEILILRALRQKKLSRRQGANLDEP